MLFIGFTKSIRERPPHEDLRGDAADDGGEEMEDDGEAQRVFYKECDIVARGRIDQEEEQQRELGYHRAMMEAIEVGREPF